VATSVEMAAADAGPTGSGAGIVVGFMSPSPTMGRIDVSMSSLDEGGLGAGTGCSGNKGGLGAGEGLCVGSVTRTRARIEWAEDGEDVNKARSGSEGNVIAARATPENTIDCRYKRMTRP